VLVHAYHPVLINKLTTLFTAVLCFIVLLVMLNVDTICGITKLACVSMKLILVVNVQRMVNTVHLHMARMIFVYPFLKWERKREILWILAVVLVGTPAVLIN
jgi:hypothetical protein